MLEAEKLTVMEHEKKFDLQRNKVQELTNFFVEYEKLSSDTFGSQDSNTYQIFDNPSNDHVKKKFETQSIQSKQNPYSQIKNAIQYQIYEIDAVMEALTQRRRL